LADKFIINRVKLKARNAIVKKVVGIWSAYRPIILRVYTNIGLKLIEIISNVGCGFLNIITAAARL
jgi:hypothetical protein